MMVHCYNYKGNHLMVGIANIRMNKPTPIKVKYVTPKRLNKPWLTPAIMKSLKNKSKIFKLYKLSKVTRGSKKNYRKQFTESN